MLELTIKNKPVEIKFNLRLMFKMNKKLATTNQETGQKNNDGVGVFFSKIIAEDIEGIIDLIQMLPGKYNENDAIEAIENYLDGEDELKPLFDDIKEELVTSGFFNEQISKYIQNIEKAQKYLATQKDEESELQMMALEDQVTEMKTALKS